MKNILIIIMVFCGTVQAQKIKSAGMWMNDDAFKGQPMVFGEDEAMQTVLASIEAYNSGDVEKELTFYTKDMQDKNGDFSRQWHAETSMLKMTPWVMIPVKINEPATMDIESNKSVIISLAANPIMTAGNVPIIKNKIYFCVSLF